MLACVLKPFEALDTQHQDQQMLAFPEPISLLHFDATQGSHLSLLMCALTSNTYTVEASQPHANSKLGICGQPTLLPTERYSRFGLEV